MQNQNDFLYFADPMCSWCWGFAPVIELFKQRIDQEAHLYVFLGGLSRDTQEPLNETSKQSIREHWEHVHELTNQPFNFKFFERDDFIYNTKLACRAVVTARRIKQESQLDFLIHLHRNFYVELRDINDPLTLYDLAAEFGFDKSEFQLEFNKKKTIEETESDFKATQQFGVRGYPTLYAGNMEQGYTLITQGYQPWKNIESAVTSWLKNQSA
jgi:putative protein-disulfide isomerase